MMVGAGIKREMMQRPAGRTLVICHILGLFMLLGVGSITASTQTRDLFVSPTTGVGVGSVWGVFIGVSQYQHAELNLQYADQDARALHAFFTSQFQSRIPADQFMVLTNEEASRGHILRALGEVLRRAQPEDLVILSFAMHGLLDPSGRDLYFLTHEADPNFPEDDGLSRHDLLRQIDRSKAKKIVLLLDACHTGAFGSSSALVAMRAANAADINRLLTGMGEAQGGMAVLTSSSAAERSQEGEQFCGGHGAFTCALLTGLKGEADNNRNGLIELRELYDFTYRAVKDSTEGYQNPAIEGRYDNGLPLAYATEGVPAPPPASGGRAMADDVARLQAELEALKQSRQDQRVLAELQALKEQLAEMQSQPPEPPPVVAKAPSYTAPQRLAQEITGQDGAPMVLIPEGEFMMGTDAGEIDRLLRDFPYGEREWVTREQPRHRVALDAFYLDRDEVTNRLFEKFVQATGHRTTAEREGKAYAFVEGKDWKQIKGASWRQPEGEATVLVSNRLEHPVVAVSWEDANAYCRHHGKRLPTEAEWEYAARAGTETRYWWGNGHPGSRRVANVADESVKSPILRLWIMTGYDDGYARTAPVGSYEANPWGLHDMIGNVWEWTADWYGENYYQQSPERNPRGPSSGQSKVIRGGSWNAQPFGIRSANRGRISPADGVDAIGFRCAQDAP